jgi:hypothetical protein
MNTTPNTTLNTFAQVTDLDPRFVSRTIIAETERLLAQLRPAELAEVRRAGYTLRAVEAVEVRDRHGNLRTTDDVRRDSRPWYEMDCYVLGYILGVFEGSLLVNRDQVLAQVSEEFGPAAWILH